MVEGNQSIVVKTHDAEKRLSFSKFNKIFEVDMDQLYQTIIASNDSSIIECDDDYHTLSEAF